MCTRRRRTVEDSHSSAPKDASHRREAKCGQGIKTIWWSGLHENHDQTISPGTHQTHVLDTRLFGSFYPTLTNACYTSWVDVRSVDVNTGTSRCGNTNKRGVFPKLRSNSKVKSTAAWESRQRQSVDLCTGWCQSIPAERNIRWVLDLVQLSPDATWDNSSDWILILNLHRCCCGGLWHRLAYDGRPKQQDHHLLTVQRNTRPYTWNPVQSRNRVRAAQGILFLGKGIFSGYC